MRVSDLACGNDWNYLVFAIFLVTMLSFFSFSLGSIDFDFGNYWVWYPGVSRIRISKSIYLHSSHTSISDDAWPGWAKLWKLQVAPRVRHFLWLTFHGRLNTYEYLFNLKLGPSGHCIFCGFMLETAEHLLLHCKKA